MGDPFGELLPVEDQANVRPIFVVGFNGSGTTMLSESLGRHPDIYALPDEVRLIPYLLERASQFGPLTVDENFLRAWRRILDMTPAFRRVGGGTLPLIPSNWRDFERNVPAIIDAILRTFSARYDKVRWCEKSPQNMLHMALIADAFPHSQFIHIVRDGRDCAASLHRRWRRTSDLVLHRWQAAVAEARRQGATLANRYHEVRFEDLTRNPRQSMESLLGFLELGFTEEVLVSSHPQSARRGELGGIEENSGNWRTYFDAPTLTRLEQIAGHRLTELDYPRLHPGCRPKSPSSLALWRWRLRDFVHAQARQYVRRRSRGSSLRGFRGLFAELFVSVRSFRSKRF